MKRIDWPSFISQHDLIFEDLPTGWKNAPHFGNAMLGSMLYVLDGRYVLEIFRSDVTDHRDESHGWTAYSRPRLCIGWFTINTLGEPTGCSLRQDLWNAELRGNLSTTKGSLSIRHFVHAEDMAIYTEITTSGEETLPEWEWHPYSPTTARPGYPENDEQRQEFAKKYGEHYLETLKPLTPNPKGHLKTIGRTKLWTQNLLVGGQYATAWTLKTEGEKQKTMISISNSYPESTAGKEAELMVEAYMDKPLGEWEKIHRDWWHAYYPQSYVELPSKDLEALYWQTMFRYACNSRPDRFYVDTSGLWYQPSPWPYTTHDWNTQSSHWAVYTANRLEQGIEVVNRLNVAQETLVANVYPEEWREDSAYLALSTVADMVGTRRSDMRYYDLLGCLPWLLHNVWWQYRYSMDETILRDTLFPLLRRAVNLYFHGMTEDEAGRFHLQKTYSPEAGIDDDVNFDLALFKWGCHTLLKSAKILDIDDPLIPRWREVIEKLTDYPIDEKGFMMGRSTTAPYFHRHLSHLMMIYPLFLVNIDQSDVEDLLHLSYLTAHGEPDVVDGEARDVAAMVQTHAGPLGAAIGDGDRALVGLRRLQEELETNGLWGCGGNPCIESTLGLATIIQDMLLQSWGDPALDEAGPIRVFPSLPSEWKDKEIEFHDLRTEGAFLVSARREEGETKWIRIKSLAGEPCRIRTDIVLGESLVNGVAYNLSKDLRGDYILELGKGDEAILNQHSQNN